MDAVLGGGPIVIMDTCDDGTDMDYVLTGNEGKLFGFLSILDLRKQGVVVIVCKLKFQLPVQSMPFTTNVVSSNTAQVSCTRYNIIHQ
jgi:hypothetical protein